MYKKVIKKGSLFNLVILLALLLPTGLVQVAPAGSGTALAAPVAPAEVAAETTTIALQVTSARTEPKALDGAGVTKGDPVDQYEFLINIDNTGDFTDSTDCNPFLDEAYTQRNPNYPEGCDWPSIRTVPGWAPIYFQGTQDDLNELVTLDLPAGKYLISVTADGYKIDGEHFTIPAPDPDGDGVALLEVGVHPYPLPPATLVIKVFEDMSMTNGQYDAPVENGLAGFRASINDIAGEITADLFGNPLCTVYEKDPNTGEVLYDADGAPVIQTLGGGCYSDADGIISIPNIGPIRYDVLVFPPSGENWIQTTTLEGSQGFDTWLQEGGTGLDNEFLIAAEPFPWTIFGYAAPCQLGDPTDRCPANDNITGNGGIKGQIWAAATYIPAKGGLSYQGTTFGGLMGTKEDRPINKPWISVNDLQNGDTAIWVGQGNPDGTFEITGLPAGNYLITYWDEKQHFILDWMQVTVKSGQITDVGHRHLTGWFTEVSGTVFSDTNENGRRDPGEPPLPNYTVVLKDRDNTEIDRMSIASTTDGAGFYELEKAYPMGSWMVLEAYSDLYRTTGVTYQTLNMKEEKTLLGGIVDLGILPILGQPVRVDWGVKRYASNENGGIAGTVFYDTVRAEDDARYAGAEPWQPGIPELTLKLYKAEMDIYGNPIKAADGSYKKGQLLAETITETFARPKGCAALDVDGNPVDFAVLPNPADNKDCLEGPLAGTSIGDGQNNLDGNWGFGDGCFGPGGYDPATGACADGSEPTPLPAGNYLVEVEIPNDASGKPMFKVTREEDSNIFDGDEFIPAVPPPACAGPLHTVDIKDSGEDFYPEQTWEENGVTITVPASEPVDNPGYLEIGGSRFEGMTMPLCNVKHIYLSNAKAVAPIFTLWTDVPIPGKWKGYIIDNLNISTNPFELFYGEMAPVPNVPIGLYDFTGRLVETVHSDRNGVYETLLPSTKTTNAPTPSGMLANLFYLYGNDPGPIGRPNANYNPQYRSIGTSFEIYPGTINPSDLAPFQNGVGIWAPGSQFNALAQCKLEDTTPQLYAVSKPYGSEGNQFTIKGLGFGATRGGGVALLGNTPLTVISWSDREILVQIPTITPGPWQLKVIANNGQSTLNGLTFHVLGGDYTPQIFEVGVGHTYDPADYDGTGRGPIQHALDDAWAAGGPAVVVVYPGLPVEMINPLGMYVENPVIYAPVKLQGVGPGGVYPDADAVPGAIIDGRGVGGDTGYSGWWRGTLIPEIWNNRGGWDRGLMDDAENPRIYEGAVITVFGEEGEFTAGFKPSIDGFILQGGDQQGFPNNLNFLGQEIPGVQPIVIVQGGAIYVDGYGENLQITNNLIQSNGGAYGSIRLGTPHVAEPLSDNHNDNIRITNNRILANGGSNLAGAIGIFNGADNYEIAYNDLCGNFSAEYGGAISHYGYSANGKIHHNRIYFNRSYDEGGGIMIAGELPADPSILTPGAGPVDIYNNRIQSNLGNDDGGGLRFLMAGNFPYNVYNNIIVNNISTHEGGGISINDAPDVRVINNTIMKNITTATAMTSDGTAAPAGLSTSRNSNLLQASLPATAPLFSNPVILNNIFWDNRAGYWDGDGVRGIGLTGDPNPINRIDIGVAGNFGTLYPVSNMFHVSYPGGVVNLVGQNPMVMQEYDTSLEVMPWRGNANAVGINIVAVDLPVTLMGNYHLQFGSLAINRARPSQVIGDVRYFAPTTDYDDQARFRPDIGADEYFNTTFAEVPSYYEVFLPIGITAP